MGTEWLLSHQEGDASIALVNAPFASIFTPSIQLGTLKAICTREGIAVDDVYLNVAFARALGLPLYNAVCFFSNPQLGEWLFGESAFAANVDAGRYVQRFEADLQPLVAATRVSVTELERVRREIIPPLVKEIAKALSRYDVVGFSSTFQQNVPTLALARAIKTVRPAVTIVVGGSNVHGPMGREYLRAFEFIDYVVTGEADHIVAPLFRALLDGGDASACPGVLGRRGRAPDRDPVFEGDMDSLPIPDYGAYFSAMRAVDLDVRQLGYPIAIPYESSRGCWWGAKHHCTFCGLNTMGMAFRAKSAARVREELDVLRRAHGVNRFDATDNIIAADGKSELLSALSTLQPTPDLFYEIKSNIGPRDAAMLAQAGVRRVQPGIESLNTRTLGLMKKGVSALHNINALRWLGIFGIRAEWNVLFGFPDEELKDYEQQLAMVPKLTHLNPPSRVNRIRLDRFSPNLENAELRGLFEGVRPAESYGYIYPDSVDLERLAYHFDGTAVGGLTEEQLRPFIGAVEDWQRSWGRDRELIPFGPPPKGRPRLVYWRTERDEAQVVDGRDVRAAPKYHRIDRTRRDVLESFLAGPRRLRAVLQRLADTGSDEGRLRDAVRELREAGWLLEEGEFALSLPMLNADDALVAEYASARKSMPIVSA